MTRPNNITAIQTGEELKQWYWLKQELVAFARHLGISAAGSKFEILERLANALDNVHAQSKILTTKPTPQSRFNWATEALTVETVITDSYRNSQNVRAFFKEHCGDTFHFSIPFMDWMKANVGKTLGDAVQEWERLHERKSDKEFASHIPESNQFNQYMRDFFADNPDKTIEEARHYWKLKRSLPLGRHRYERSDLQLKFNK